ncbi:hypothetical protein HHI36_011444 [Cryptolaemus montrouzieri]|uniref:RWD domain-containing protein n=1 Tax=Cryptolaemus montrouzieri TaxID=559131 RepID=A0ABD2MM07_9CUCU
MNNEKLKQNLEIQLEELESLQSMFYNHGELKIEDPVTLFEIKNYINETNGFVPPELDMTINLEVDSLKFQLYVNLPQEYPDISPTVFVRNEKLNRIQNGKLNRDLKEFMENLEKGEPCIFSAISWVQDNATTYVDMSSDVKDISESIEDPPSRLWIYSHHIYSKTKRREIINQAQSLNLNGFCLPGKPGIICVEGATKNCNEWWQIIRSMTWKKIYCKITEEFDDESDFLKFDKFEEVSFQTNNLKCNHMDMGELCKYLEIHKCSYIFKDLFGVEGKLTSS